MGAQHCLLVQVAGDTGDSLAEIIAPYFSGGIVGECTWDMTEQAGLVLVLIGLLFIGRADVCLGVCRLSPFVVLVDVAGTAFGSRGSRSILVADISQAAKNTGVEKETGAEEENNLHDTAADGRGK